VLLHEDLPGFIIERNMGLEIIAGRNINVVSLRNVGRSTPSRDLSC
jgi:hypothetical protein